MNCAGRVGSGAADLENGNDYYFAFATYAEALAHFNRTEGAEEPLALIRQVEYIDEPTPGDYRHVREIIPPFYEVTGRMSEIDLNTPNPGGDNRPRRIGARRLPVKLRANLPDTRIARVGSCFTEWARLLY